MTRRSQRRTHRRCRHPRSIREPRFARCSSTTGHRAGPTGFPSCRSPSRYLAEFLATTARGPRRDPVHDHAPEPQHHGAHRRASTPRSPAASPSTSRSCSRRGRPSRKSRTRRAASGSRRPAPRRSSSSTGRSATALEHQQPGQHLRVGVTAPTRRSVARSGSAASTSSACTRTSSTRRRRATRRSTRPSSARTKRAARGRRSTSTSASQPDDSVVTAYVIRSVVHIEARHTMDPEQLALDFVDTIKRTGALIHEYTSTLLVLVPEHAEVFANAGWSKDDLRDFIFENATRDRAELVAVGKDALSNRTSWRLPSRPPRLDPRHGVGDRHPRHRARAESPDLGADHRGGRRQRRCLGDRRGLHAQPAARAAVLHGTQIEA